MGTLENCGQRKSRGWESSASVGRVGAMELWESSWPTDWDEQIGIQMV
jgi:hypothetical protein